jgi:archaellum component FlaG (FlaF/FlaG flagellin family)
MADGGASSFIFLTTALLVSGLVSVVLINQWGDMARASQDQTRAMEVNQDTSLGFAGDPMMVAYNSTLNPDEMTFYLQNTGTTLLDTSTLIVLVDGSTVTSSITTAIIPAAGTAWDSNHLVEVTVNSTSWSYANGTDVSLTVIVSSEVTNGYRGTDTISLEVRLHG